jgi:hypothetical protein
MQIFMSGFMQILLANQHDIADVEKTTKPITSN